MLLIYLALIGLVMGLAVAMVIRSARGRFALAAVGIAVWIVYAVYIATIAACPRRGECDKGLGVIFFGALVVGWLAGVATSWALGRALAGRREM